MIFRPLTPIICILLSVLLLPNCKKKDDPQPIRIHDTVTVTLRDTIYVRDTVYLLNPGSSTEPRHYVAVLMGAQTASAGSFFSPTTGQVYLTGDSANFATNKVDFSYAMIGGSLPELKPELISPTARRSRGLAKVHTLNRHTIFRRSGLTYAQFQLAKNEDLAAQAISGSEYQDVEVGRVYEFINEEGKKGLIHVTRIDAPGTFSSAIVLEVKFQN